MLILLLLLALPDRSSPFAAESDKTVGDILSAAESMFHSMRGRDYRGIWERLSDKSARTIIDETAGVLAKSGRKANRDEVRRDFREGGPIARGYWRGFLEHFDPDQALEESRWEMGKVGPEAAEILITHRNAEKPAIVKLYREEGAWKVGLVETFWGRKEFPRF